MMALLLLVTEQTMKISKFRIPLPHRKQNGQKRMQLQLRNHGKMKTCLIQVSFYRLIVAHPIYTEEEQQVVSPPPPAAPKEKTKLELAIERKEAAERAYREQLAQQLKKEEANLATKNISDAKVAEKLRLQKMVPL